MKFVFILILLTFLNISTMAQEYTANYWLQKGDEFYNNRSYDLALRCYDKAIEIDPLDANAWNNKGNALKELDRIAESDAAFAKAEDLTTSAISDESSSSASDANVAAVENELDYIGFITSETGDTGFNGVLVLHNAEGYAINPISGDFTVEVYGDGDYQDKIFERSFEVPSSGWGEWGLNKVPAWPMSRIAYKDIGDGLPEYLYIKAIFKPTGTSEEFTDKTMVWM